MSNSDILLDRIVDGAEDTNQLQITESFPDDDPDAAEWAQLRCSSTQTEVLAERNRRNRQPSAGYPGLAFGHSIFSSGTMMKFRILSNELHNIMNVQLRRAEGEVAALGRRIQVLESDLEQSEQKVKQATVTLEEASQAIEEDERIKEAIQTRASIEDDRIALLQTQLGQARLVAEESEQNYLQTAQRIAQIEGDIHKHSEEITP